MVEGNNVVHANLERERILLLHYETCEFFMPLMILLPGKLVI